MGKLSPRPGHVSSTLGCPNTVHLRNSQILKIELCHSCVWLALHELEACTHLRALRRSHVRPALTHGGHAAGVAIPDVIHCSRMSRARAQKRNMPARTKRGPPHVGTQVRRVSPNRSKNDLQLLALSPRGALAHQRANSILCDEDGRDVDKGRWCVRRLSKRHPRRKECD